MGMERVVIAAPETVAKKLETLLGAAEIVPDSIVHTGREAEEEKDCILLTTWQLLDMTGTELAKKLGEAAEVLMIVPQDFKEDVPGNVLLLHNPISRDMLVQAVRTASHYRGRICTLRAEVEKLNRTLEDRKVIERAKGRLMDTLHLSESEAHYQIQKRSMDTGKRIADVAREILEEKE